MPSIKEMERKKGSRLSDKELEQLLKRNREEFKKRSKPSGAGSRKAPEKTVRDYGWTEAMDKEVGKAFEAGDKKKMDALSKKMAASESRLKKAQAEARSKRPTKQRAVKKAKPTAPRKTPLIGREVKAGASLAKRAAAGGAKDELQASEWFEALKNKAAKREGAGGAKDKLQAPEWFQALKDKAPKRAAPGKGKDELQATQWLAAKRAAGSAAKETPRRTAGSAVQRAAAAYRSDGGKRKKTK